MYAGFVVAGIGVVLAILNGIGAKYDSPQAKDRTAQIAMVLILGGLVVQWAIWYFGGMG